MSSTSRGRTRAHVLPDENFLYVFKGGPLRGPPGAPDGRVPGCGSPAGPGTHRPARPRGRQKSPLKTVTIAHYGSRHTGRGDRLPRGFRCSGLAALRSGSACHRNTEVPSRDTY